MKTIIAVIFLVFTIVIGMSMIDQHFQTPNTNSSIVVNESSSTSSSEEIQEQVKVILTGEVIKPGTYTIEKGLYLEEAIQLAGGITSNADSSCFNYFYVILEDIALYIAPKTIEDKISLNNADVKTLVNLEGIGPTLANAIIEYRETIKEYEYIEEIMEVKGIGKQTFEKNKDKLCL